MLLRMKNFRLSHFRDYSSNVLPLLRESLFKILSTQTFPATSTREDKRISIELRKNYIRGHKHKQLCTITLGMEKLGQRLTRFDFCESLSLCNEKKEIEWVKEKGIER